LHTIAQWLAPGLPEISTSVRRQLLAFVLDKNTAWLLAHGEVQLNAQQLQQLNQYQKQYLTGTPLAYIIGRQPFWDLLLKVNEHTLIPRPDTELIIETLLELAITPHHILDLGTGSGALALVLARLYPTSQVTATDISQQALKVATDNAHQYQIKNIQFKHSDWLKDIQAENFDLIVSNPPYIEPKDEHLKDLVHEPIHALVSEQDGLADLKTIIEHGRIHLSHKGLLMVEHGYNQQQAVFDLFVDNQYSHIKTLFDIEQRPRATMGYRH